MCVLPSSRCCATLESTIAADRGGEATDEEWTFEGSPLYEDEDVDDPFEPFNRLMFRINGMLDKAFIMPVSMAYRHLVPNPVQTGVSNFVGNFFSPIDAINFILQGDGEHVAKTVLRFVINTLCGFFGVADVAQKMGIEKKQTSFGDTLKKWGAKPGPYLVLPLLGPGSARSGLGKMVHCGLDPLTQKAIINHEKNLRRRWYYVIYGARTVITRADLLPFTIELEKISSDMYVSTRKAVMAMEEG
ncbi:MAG: VacJ family lipoprotein [Holosporales bacterium]|jgi:phospholipid-binding lipoprotein MlaA|nr:VacJ family lipoprotein [Holosporales bacterium]